MIIYTNTYPWSSYIINLNFAMKIFSQKRILKFPFQLPLQTSLAFASLIWRRFNSALQIRLETHTYISAAADPVFQASVLWKRRRNLRWKNSYSFLPGVPRRSARYITWIDCLIGECSIQFCTKSFELCLLVPPLLQSKIHLRGPRLVMNLVCRQPG